MESLESSALPKGAPVSDAVSGDSLESGRPDASDRWAAALAYVFILCWIPYLFFTERPFVRYHARQGVALFLSELVGAFVLWIVDITLGRIPFLGLLILILLRLVIFLAALALSVLGFARGLSGEIAPVPWLGGFGEGLPEPPFRAGR